MIGLTDRYKFPLYKTRAEFKAASGFEAPAFRGDWPIKQWLDPNPAQAPLYSVWNGSLTEPKLVILSMPLDEAGAVNLPGVATFPAYVPAPTAAMRQLFFGGRLLGVPQPVDAATLSTKAKADALAALVGATVVMSSTLNQFFQYNWAGESRRDYILQYQGQASGPFVGDLLKDMNAKGVGAPGHWSASQIAAGHLQWVAEVMDDGSGAHPMMDIPLALAADEELYSEVQGLVPFVGIRKIGVPAPPVTGAVDTPLALDTNRFVHKIAAGLGLR